MKKRLHTKQSLFCLLMVFVISLGMFACANQNASHNDPEINSSQTSEAQSSASEETAEQKTYPEVEEDGSAWSQLVFDESLQKLVSQGLLEYNPEGYLFNYSAENSIVFLHLDAIEQYLKTPVLVEGKIICAYWSQSTNGFSVAGKDDNYPATLNPNMPRYAPVYIGGEPVYPDVDQDIFANGVDECDTLIVYGGFESDRDVEYYMGGIDRVETTTLVFIIDAKKRELLHVEWIGTDSPGFSTQNTTGRVMTTEAEEYIASVLPVVS